MVEKIEGFCYINLLCLVLNVCLLLNDQVLVCFYGVQCYWRYRASKSWFGLEAHMNA